MLDLVELILGLLLAVAGLSLLSRRIPIPYPVLLVLGGLLLALVPGLPRVKLNPELVFLFFLVLSLVYTWPVVLDFNRAANLPCAYTDLATCPLPPAENRLPVAIEAGEKTPYERQA